MSYLLFHIFFILPPILLLARKGPLLATVGRRAGLGLILAWAGPVLAAQWAYGGDVVWKKRRSWAVGAPSVAPTRPLPSRTRSSFPG